MARDSAAFHIVFATGNIVTPFEKIGVSGIGGAAVGGMVGNPLVGADALAFGVKTWNHVHEEFVMAAMEKIDWSDCPLVEVKPGVQSGAPVLRGTRMPVNAIVDNFDYGVSAAEIAEQFEIPPESVQAILTYAQSHRFAHPV
jgi:uncharacterized protein (DUF433 family)